MDSVINDLVKLGFSHTDSAILLCLVENERMTVAGIVRLTGLKRSTIYSAADEMSNLGVLKKDITGKVTYYTLSDIKDLKIFLSREKKKVEEKEEVLGRLLPKLEKIPRTRKFVTPRVQVVTGEDIYDFLYKRFAVWNQSMIDSGDPTHWGFQDDSILKDPGFVKFIEHYWRKSPPEIRLRVFGSDPDFASEFAIKDSVSEYKERRQSKFVKDLPFTSNQWILGEYIIHYVISEKPNRMVEIRDRLLADNLRLLFKKLWEDN